MKKNFSKSIILTILVVTLSLLMNGVVIFAYPLVSDVPIDSGTLDQLRSTDTTITLIWGESPSTNDMLIDGYHIYRNDTLVGTVLLNGCSFDGSGNAQFTDSGLTPLTTYSYTVKTYLTRYGDEIESEGMSLNANTCADLVPPTAPTNLTQSDIGESSVSITWNASTDDIALNGYDVYRNCTWVGSVAGDVLTYTDTGLNPYTVYNYSVIAKDTSGNVSQRSEYISVLTLDITAPTAPSNLTSSNVTWTSATLTWNASTDNVGVTGYDIYKNNTLVDSVAGNVLTYTDTSLAPATTYTYMVKARDKSLNISAQSNSLDVITPEDTTPPTTPASLVSSDVTDSKVTLTWTASTDNVGVTGYEIFRDFKLLNSVAGNILTYTDTGLSPLTVYTYVIVAKDGSGNKALVNPATLYVKTTQDVTSPTAPTNLTSSNITWTSATLTWNASTDNAGVTGYDVYKNNTLVNSVAGNVLTYTDTSLTPGTTYTYMVKAKDAMGNISTASTNINLTTVADTQAPTIPQSFTYIRTISNPDTDGWFRWKPSSDNVAVAGYNCYYDGKLTNYIPASLCRVDGSYLKVYFYDFLDADVESPYFTGPGYFGRDLIAHFRVAAVDIVGNVSSKSNEFVFNTQTILAGGTGFPMAVKRYLPDVHCP